MGRNEILLDLRVDEDEDGAETRPGQRRESFPAPDVLTLCTSGEAIGKDGYGYGT